jgi:hypothetical protein
MSSSSASPCPLRPEIRSLLTDEERAWLDSIPEQMVVLEQRAEAAEQRAKFEDIVRAAWTETPMPSLLPQNA